MEMVSEKEIGAAIKAFQIAHTAKVDIPLEQSMRAALEAAARVRAEAAAEGGETLVDVVTENVWQHDASQDNCLVIDTDGLADDPAPQPSVKVKPLDEDDDEEIISAAAINMRKATSGARRQMVTVQASLDWWVMKETERRILSALTAGKPHP